MINKELLRKRELDRLHKILGSSPDGRKSTQSRKGKDQDDKGEVSEKDATKTQAELGKDLFAISHKKNQFFEAAKQMMNSNVLPTSSSHMQSFKRFYDRC